MLPLGGNDFPKSAAELKNALETGLARFGATSPGVQIDGQLPRLGQLAIICPGLEIGRLPLVPAREGEAAFGVERLSMEASPVRYETIAGSFQFEASQATVAFQRSSRSGSVLVLQRVGSGRMEIAVARTELEKFARQLATDAARSQGVSIESAKMEVTGSDPRAVAFAFEITAKKLFFTTTVRLTGRIEVDDNLRAKACGLRCEGDGVVGSLASGFLQPYLQRYEGRQFDLAALGEIQVSGVTLDAGDPLRVLARLGGVTS